MGRTRIVMSFLALLLSGCSLPWLPFWEYVPSEAELAADLARRRAAIPGLNRLGFMALQGALAGQPGKNVALSPASLGRTLLMVYTGARGSTRDAMASVLGMPDQSETTLSNWALASSPSLDKRGVTITMRDSAWVQSGFAVQQQYKEDLRRMFGAEVRSFQDANDGTTHLQGWISDTTGGLLDGRNFKLEESTRLALADVLVFKGLWEEEFQASQTQPRPFYREPGVSVPVPMMQHKADYAYTEAEGFQVIRLPYQRSAYAMYVLMPAEGAAEPASLDGDRFERLVSGGMKRPGEILLPRFSMGLHLPLNSILKAAGMDVAFSDGADFSGIAPGLKVESVGQQVRIELDEKGTVAAAATVGMVGVTSAPPSPFRMEVNRPFFFAIRDDASKAVLFLGRVTSP